MIFVSLPIRLRIPSNCGLTYADNEFVHAALLKAISNLDPDVGQWIHDTQWAKPVAIGLVLKQPNTPILRVTVMADEGARLSNLLVRMFAINPELRLGSVKCMVESVDLNCPVWGGLSTWANLMNETGSHLNFDFITPTAIMKKGPSGRRYSYLLPDPRDIFTGLWRRWNRLGGPPLPEIQDYVADGGCVISRLDNLRTVGFRTSKRTQIGFLGRVRYELRGDEQDYARSLTALTKFAGFGGVGYQTARGMGVVRTTIERRNDR